MTNGQTSFHEGPRGENSSAGLATECDVSFVIPVYRSEECLARLENLVREVCNEANLRYELVLVNDCSPDGSWAKIVELAAEHSSVRGINLRRNFGQDSALMAGLRAASGRVIVIMDDDLQHDPADAPRLVAAVRDEGWDICYARFPSKRQAWWKNAGSWLNGWLATWVLNKPKDVYLSPYKAIARGVVDEIVRYDGPFPYVDGLLFGITQRITQIDVEHHARYKGRGNYGLGKSLNTWLRLATSFSIAPLRIVSVSGFFSAIVGLLLALVYTIRRLAGVETPLGWAALMVTVLVLGGVQLAALGMMGEYLGRVFLHLNKRPQYVLREACGFPATAKQAP